MPPKACLWSEREGREAQMSEVKAREREDASTTKEKRTMDEHVEIPTEIRSIDLRWERSI